MVWILGFIIILVIILGPQLWTRHILKKYSQPRADFPGTGGEFAQHLIKQQALSCQLEATDQGDHYDPTAKTVRLSDENLNGKSLTAVVVAAHEVGHAIQHKQNMTWMTIRAPLAKVAYVIERVAQVAILASPIFLTFAPSLSRISILIAIIGMLASTLVHFITLPVEFDASFGKAMPILKQGQYLSAEDLIKARKILLACALTYVSGALASLLNVWRWIRFFRR